MVYIATHTEDNGLRVAHTMVCLSVQKFEYYDRCHVHQNEHQLCSL